MKITINESSNNSEVEIIIKCKAVDDEIHRIMSMIKNSEEKILGIVDGSTHFIEPENIFYFESVDKKTFMYTKSQVLETHLKLYEIEKKLTKYDFFRASKSTVINISKIKRLSPRFNGKLEVLLENDERLIISRQYVRIIKEILGL
ncbi:putative HTH-type transcriptional regulator [bioreactor metagenome]|uniref:Putative HTH-type transcriptional regulator n=1 Tax=bioreactor metagenome TaxID=1076179 RepID=A0A645CNE7_9ZZZZ|nr:LytTR family DNA-binding domain-containing protein [Clostridium sp. HMP27]KGK89952.1 histidine kinase [Clostridium sp. HMP27]